MANDLKSSSTARHNKFAPIDVEAALTSKGDVLTKPVLPGASRVRPSRKKSRDELEDLDERALRAADEQDVGTVMSDVTGWVVAQLDSAAVLGSGGASSAASGAAAASSAAAASGAAVTTSAVTATGAAGAAAASAASVVTTTTVTTVGAAASTGTLAAVAGGVAAAAGGSGGGGTSADPAPAPLPPANPFLGGGSGSPPDPSTLNVLATPQVAENRLVVSDPALPAGIRNKSLVIDLGADSGPYQGRLFFTHGLDGVQTTDVMPYRDIQHVQGTQVNDQITGHAGNNTLAGGLGDDIIYGAGGADVLRGEVGQDWVLFRPLTRGDRAGPYDDGVIVDLAAGTYVSASQTNNVATEASGFEHAGGSQGNDRLLGTDQSNILVGFQGDDHIDGRDGNDHLLGGGSATNGNQLTGGAGQDVFWVGYDLNPVVRATQIGGTTLTASSPLAFDLLADRAGVTEVAGVSVVRDWEVGQDALRVSFSGVAVMGGLLGQVDWAGSDTVDLRTSVVNEGLVKVAAGAGSNQIFASTGSEQIWVGYNFLVVNGFVNGVASPFASGDASDIIWGWDDQTTRRDQLNVIAGSTAVIGLLQGKSNWDAGDLVDLRQWVNNSGVVVVSTGAGNNTVHGSAGVDHIYGSAGAGMFNQVWGGAGGDQFYVGTHRNAADGVTTTVASRDLIWDWQQGTDTLHVQAGAVAVLAGRLGIDWGSADTVSLASGVNNAGTVVIALGVGDDTITGSSGVDHIYGGTSSAAGNRITGGAGSDHFFVGFNYNPITDTRQTLGAADTAIDLLMDWQTVDQLTIGARGQAIVAGLFGLSDWTGNDVVNVAHATNDGLIRIAAGAGQNTITVSSGVDHIHVGSQFVASSSVSTPAGLNAVDVIERWDDQSVRRDHLYVAAGSRAVVGSLLNQLSWDGNDVVDLRQQVSNSGLIQIAAGKGNNTLFGSSGSDHFYVGYTNTGSGGTAPLSSGSAFDMVHGWDAQEWNALPFAGSWNGSTNWNGQATADATHDRLSVGLGSTARIGSLLGDSATDSTRWDGVEVVDLRSHVSNLNMVAAHGGGIEIWTGADSDYIYGSSGRDLIYGGPGLDNLWGGAGDDVFYVGFSPAWAPFGADAAEHRIWDWQNGGSGNAAGSADSPGDGLRIADGSFAIIQGTYGMDSTNANRWSGADLVDLRWDVINNGKIIVESGTGNDTVYGSAGVDFINPGAGFNNIHLANGGADRVYLDDFQTRTQITGFGADDKIYLDTRVLNSFVTAKGINTIAGYNVTASATNTATISLGRDQNDGNFRLSELTYGATYNGALRAYNASPKDPDFNVYGGMGDGPFNFGWSDNGAWSNSAHDSAHLTGKVAVIAAGAASILVGNGLATIPFVGPILAIAPWVIGGLMLNDGINNVAPYQNPVYNGGTIITGVGVLTPALVPAVASTDTWNDVSFLSFYNQRSGFTQSLEVAGQQPGYTQIAANAAIPGSSFTLPYTFFQAPALTGVASFLAVYNGTNGTDGETYIYLVASRDSLIQNNETILVAQVNGRVTHDQLVMYNGSTDADYLRYFSNPVVAPVMPPEPSLLPTQVVSLTSGKQVLFNASFAPVAFAVTEGTATSRETNQVTFRALEQGEQVSLAGLTFTASRNITSVEAATAFQSLAVSATTGAGTAYGTYSGSLANWSTSTVTGSGVVFSSTQVTGDVSNLSFTANRLSQFLDATALTALGSSATVTGVHTNAASVQLRVNFNKPTVAGDSVKVYLDGVLVSNLTDVAVGVNFVDVLLSSLGSDGIKTIKAVVTSAQGFEAETSMTLVVDTAAPALTAATDADPRVVVTDTVDGIVVSSTEPGWLRLGSVPALRLSDLNGNQTMVKPSAGSSQSTVNLSVEDIFGHSAALGQVSLGTSLHDGTTAAPITSAAQYVYGFGGNDVLTSTFAGANGLGASLYGGEGNDTLIGTSANNKLVGGRGADLLDLNGGNNTLVWGVQAAAISGGTAAASDSNSSNLDHVYDFDKAKDSLLVVATEVSNFNGLTDISVIGARSLSDPLSGVANTFSQLGINLDGVGGLTGEGDLVIEFAGNHSLADLLSVFSLDLTGTSGANTLVGTVRADVLKGGAGADTLTGGSGADTFVFALGDSLVGSRDVITDIGLVGAAAGKDTLDLVGLPVVAAQTTGTNGTDAGAIKSHAIQNGVVSFDDVDTFAGAWSGFTLTDAMAYLTANIAGAGMDGHTVVFNHGTSAYVYQNTSGAALFVELADASVAGLTTLSTDTQANYLLIG